LWNPKESGNSSEKPATEKMRSRKCVSCSPTSPSSIALPDLNGLDAAREIVKISPNTKVLILTSHCSDPLIRQTLKLGARGYLSKSDSVLDFTKAIRSLLLDKTFLSSTVSEVILNNYLNEHFKAQHEAKKIKRTRPKHHGRRRKDKNKIVHELPGGAIEVENPAEALKDESGTFEVISPYGHIFQVTCRPGARMRVQEISEPHSLQSVPTGVTWRVRRITTKMIN
jgi:YesN/AraC family two-component response regulator